MPIVKKEGKTSKPLVAVGRPLEKIEQGHFYVIRGDLENNKMYDDIVCNENMREHGGNIIRVDVLQGKGFKTNGINWTWSRSMLEREITLEEALHQLMSNQFEGD